jgi:hypothetical protein
MQTNIGCWRCSKLFTIYDSYMVKDSVWNQALPSRSPLWYIQLHIPCLEKMLGRKITKEDYTQLDNGDLRTPGYMTRIKSDRTKTVIIG